jgi:tubulin--tyrosine ligase
MFRNQADIIQFIQVAKDNFWVVQKYIERPLLYKGRKFDIRVWALLTDDFRIFFYKEGYLRTSSQEYFTSAKNNKVHLTN